MRLRLFGVVLFFGASLAACGGGGHSGGLLPVAQSSPSPSSSAQSGSRRVALLLKIPPASQQSRARRPYYVSPNTQSIAFAVVPNGSGTPTTSELQVFPVTTPSPCATISAGGESCSFTVSAPYGNDVFYVATFAVPSPNPSTTPLASFVSGSITISASPSASATPLAFTLNGIVTSVAITVASPDPNNTPNTQVIPIGTAAAPIPLAITPYDASGSAILADAFLAPITISASPASDGVGLTMSPAPTCTGSSGNASPSPSITIACAADLANVYVNYNGTTVADSSDHAIDTFVVQAEPSSSPATIVLSSNVVTWTPNPSNTYPQGYLQALSGNVVAYMLANSSTLGALYGTLSIGTGTLSASTLLNGITPTGFYTMSDGSIWVADNANDQLACFTAGSSTATATYNLSSYVNGVDDVTYDGANIWVTGYYNADGNQNYAMYVPISGTCAGGSVNLIELNGDSYADQHLLVAPRSAGTVFIDGIGDGGAWIATTSGATMINTLFSPGSAFGGGVGVDGTGEGYFAFNTDPGAGIYPVASGASTLTATSLVALPSIHFGGLAAFGPNSGAADRLAFADTTYNTLGTVEGPNSASPMPILTSVGNAEFTDGQNVAISSKGAHVTVFESQSDDDIPTIARAIFTTTWSVPVITLGGQNNVLSIDERGDSGPFTVTTVGTAPSCYGGATQIPNIDHDFIISNTGDTTCSVTLKITDKNGRSQTVAVAAEGVSDTAYRRRTPSNKSTRSKPVL
jgi:hypothetical protein